MVDGTAVHDLGGSDVQELGYVLALGAHYLRELDAAGVSVDEAATLVEFRLAATDEQFETISKLRAVRRLWARMLELSGASSDNRQMVLHAVTSRPMMTKYDPWVNMLRTCVAAFAAGVGGADAVTVLPFDARLGLPDAFSRRIARNTSSLLVEESHVAKVADPAGGAFAVEKLTDDLAVAGWEELGRIEEQAGGVLAALDDGTLQGRIDEVVAERDRQIAKRELPADRGHRVPPPSRDAAREGAVRRRSAAGAALRRAVREAPRRAGDGQGLPGDDGHRSRRTPLAPPSRPTCSRPVASTWSTRAGTTTSTRCSPTTRGSPSCASSVTTRRTPNGAPSSPHLCARPAPSWVILAGRPVEGIETDDTCAMGVDALDFLHRTREKLEASA